MLTSLQRCYGMNRILVLLGLLLVCGKAYSQELNCRVQVLSPTEVVADKRIFTTLETTIREFMNNTRWTTDQFERDERIECNLTFTIRKFEAPDNFSGNLQIQVRRPAFNTNYGSLLMNMMDDDIQFKYLEYQPIEFSESAYISGLSSLLGFYAYAILAMDYDSFAPEGGTPYWLKAQQVVNNAQQDAAKGWKGSDIPPRNRYWLVENYLNPVFKPLREANYQYHRMGIDQMYGKMEQGRAAIIDALKKVQKVNRDRPSSYNVQLFFNAKVDELVNVFKESPAAEKAQVVQLLGEIDPTNANKYRKITQQ